MFWHAEQIDDPYENNIEAEAEEYSKTRPISNTSDLVSPRDREQKFVNLLEKQYQGTFPEYGKETKSDFGKNKELEDNLSAQPETVYFGHSDRYNGKDDINDYLITHSDRGGQGNLDHSYDKNTGREQGGTGNPMKSEDYKGFTSKNNDDIFETFEKENDEEVENTNENNTDIMDYQVTETNNHVKDTNDHLSDMNDHVTPSMTDDDESNTNNNATDMIDEHVTDKESDEMEDHMSDYGSSQMPDVMDEKTSEYMVDQANKEIKKLREKTKEEALWDAEEKLREQLAVENRKKKQSSGHSSSILDDFDEMKERIHKAPEKGKLLRETGQRESKKAVKHIKYVHADDRQLEGEAILDFLNKLLEKDPKELKHDILAMTKEIQKEGKHEVILLLDLKCYKYHQISHVPIIIQGNKKFPLIYKNIKKNIISTL